VINWREADSPVQAVAVQQGTIPSSSAKADDPVIAGAVAIGSLPFARRDGFALIILIGALSGGQYCENASTKNCAEAEPEDQSSDERHGYLFQVTAAPPVREACGGAASEPGETVDFGRILTKPPDARVNRRVEAMSKMQ